MPVHKTEIPEIYTLFEPEDYTLPLLIDSPHSGRVYPHDFNYSCDFNLLKETEDNQLEVLLQNAPTYGAILLQCEFPRCYLDVNRASDDIDDVLLEELPNYPIAPTIRSHAGYGLVRRLAKPGIPIYKDLMDISEVEHRIERYYSKYHNVLQEKLDALYYNFGQVWYLNMHSMPSTSAMTEDGAPVDFVLGDRHGTTCTRDFLFTIKDFLEYAGYRVSINDPYKGVELIQRHGNPSLGRHALQFEINKALYWNEKTQEFLPQSKKLEHLLNNLFEYLADFIEKKLVLKAAD